MQATESKHPPGAVIMITGELTRYGRSLICLSMLQAPPGSTELWQQGVLIAESLNAGIQSAMTYHMRPGVVSPPLEWVWIMGDDHTYDHDVLLQLLDREQDVIAPIVLSRIPPLDPAIVIQAEGRLKPLEDLPTSGLYRLTDSETCGDAGLLVRRRVLEVTGPPWYERIRSGSLAAEDQAFTSKIRKAGFDIFIDVEHPIGHIAPMSIVPVVRGGKWAIHIAASNTPVTEIRPMRRKVA